LIFSHGCFEGVDKKPIDAFAVAAFRDQKVSLPHSQHAEEVDLVYMWIMARWNTFRTSGPAYTMNQGAFHFNFANDDLLIMLYLPRVNLFLCNLPT